MANIEIIIHRKLFHGIEGFGSQNKGNPKFYLFFVQLNMLKKEKSTKKNQPKENPDES